MKPKYLINILFFGILTRLESLDAMHETQQGRKTRPSGQAPPRVVCVSAEPCRRTNGAIPIYPSIV